MSNRQNGTNEQINQFNAFEQSYEDLISKLDPDPNLVFVDKYQFPNGSMYKGQMIMPTKSMNSDNQQEIREGYGI